MKLKICCSHTLNYLPLSLGKDQLFLQHVVQGMCNYTTHCNTILKLRESAVDNLSHLTNMTLHGTRQLSLECRFAGNIL